MSDLTCSICAKPEPREWCWMSLMNCPLGMPPRNLSMEMLLEYVQQLEKRIGVLEGDDS